MRVLFHDSQQSRCARPHPHWREALPLRGGGLRVRLRGERHSRKARPHPHWREAFPLRGAASLLCTPAPTPARSHFNARRRDAGTLVRSAAISLCTPALTLARGPSTARRRGAGTRARSAAASKGTPAPMPSYFSLHHVSSLRFFCSPLAPTHSRQNGPTVPPTSPPPLPSPSKKTLRQAAAQSRQCAHFLHGGVRRRRPFPPFEQAVGHPLPHRPWPRRRLRHHPARARRHRGLGRSLPGGLHVHPGRGHGGAVRGAGQARAAGAPRDGGVGGGHHPCPRAGGPRRVLPRGGRPLWRHHAHGPAAARARRGRGHARGAQRVHHERRGRVRAAAVHVWADRVHPLFPRRVDAGQLLRPHRAQRFGRAAHAVPAGCVCGARPAGRVCVCVRFVGQFFLLTPSRPFLPPPPPPTRPAQTSRCASSTLRCWRARGAARTCRPAS